MFVMKLFQGAGNVGMRLQVVRGIFRITLMFPPEPILHNEIERDMLCTVFSSNVDQLLRGFIAIL